METSVEDAVAKVAKQVRDANVETTALDQIQTIMDDEELQDVGKLEAIKGIVKDIFVY